MPSSPGPRHTVVLDTSPVTSLYTSCPPDEPIESQISHAYDASVIADRPDRPVESPPALGSSPSSDNDGLDSSPREPPIEHDSASTDTEQESKVESTALSLRGVTSTDRTRSPESQPQDRYDFGRIWQNYPYNTNTRPPVTTSSFLRPGSKFQGTQESDRQVYNVQVEIKYVDMAESFVCGYLRIQGLTDDHPTLTTYFEGEIIGPRYNFVTAHPEWGSSEKVDLAHWGRFPEWRPLKAQAKSHPNFSLNNFAQREHLFMRWKEYFLVPDHRVKTITGASFEGFYYICFNQCTGTVSGIYFHAKSEKYQQLELYHVSDKGCTAAIQFC